MLYHVKQDGYIVALSILDEHEGVLRSWDPAKGVLKFGNHFVYEGIDYDDYTLSEIADISFLASLDIHIGTRVNFFTDKDGPNRKVLRVEYIESSDEPVYRALLIGNSNYPTNPLGGPENTVHFMRAMLEGEAIPYQVNSQLDVASTNELLELITNTFADATKNDTSLFYYEGHGARDSGSLVMINGGSFPIDFLMSLLTDIPGEVFIVLDSCFSGNAVDYMDNDDYYDSLTQFDEAIIDSYKELEYVNASVHIITACASDEVSRSIDNQSGGMLTKGIAEGTGCSFPDGVYGGSMPADYNHDNLVSFGELAKYCEDYADRRQADIITQLGMLLTSRAPQHIQSYPEILVPNNLEQPDVVFFRNNY